MINGGDKSSANYQISSAWLFLFLPLVFVLAWTIIGLFIFAADWATSTFGELSGSHPLFILAVYAPAITALFIVTLGTGIKGTRIFLSRIRLWRASPWWYAFLVLAFPVISFTGSAIKGNVSSAPMFTEPLSALLVMSGFMLILGPMEEIGWRGLALPILQRHLVPFWAGLILGVIWATWHLPAFLLSGVPQSNWDFMPFFAGSVACSIILTAFFNQAGGSILLAMLFHFQMNNPLWPDAQPYDMYLYVAASIVVVWLNRHTLFNRDTAVTQVIPSPGTS